MLPDMELSTFIFQKYYPVNKLRNIAKSLVQTEFTFYIDVDFVPSLELQQILLEHIQNGFFDGKTVR